MLSKTFSLLAPHQCQIKGTDVWQNFSNGRNIQLSGRVNSVSVCPTSPCKFCLPNGYKVYLYTCDGDRLYRKLSGFGTRVSCCEFRRDGKLVIVGEENGTLRICTTDKNGFHLRKMNAHKGSVTAASFFTDGHTAASIGVDSVVRLWDVALGTEKHKYRLGSGSEPAKALAVGRLENNFMFCGNFEGCVSLYDIRQNDPTQTFQVPNAVSALAVNKDDSRVVVADGPSIRVWDIRLQAFVSQSYAPSDVDRSLDSLRLHYKTVTSLWVANHPDSNEAEVLISASTDKLVKVTHLTDWKELHQIRCPQPLTSVCTAPDCDTIIIGGEKGYVKVLHMNTQYACDPVRVSTDQHETKTQEESEDVNGLDPSIIKLAAEFSGRWKGGNRFVSMTTDEWLSQPFDGPRLGPRSWLAGTTKDVTQRLPLVHDTTEISRDGVYSCSTTPMQQFTKVDRLLLRFSHSQALSAVTRSRLRTKSKKGVVYMHPATLLRLAIGVIRELVRRDTLSTAVAGGTVPQLIRLLRFIRRNVWRKEAVTTCLQLYNCILDIYSAEELNAVSEFSKCNDVLRTLSRNTQALAAVTEFIEYSLTPSHSYPHPKKAPQNSTSNKKRKSLEIDQLPRNSSSKNAPNVPVIEQPQLDSPVSRLRSKTEKRHPKRQKLQ